VRVRRKGSTCASRFVSVRHHYFPRRAGCRDVRFFKRQRFRTRIDADPAGGRGDQRRLVGQHGQGSFTLVLTSVSLLGTDPDIGTIYLPKGTLDTTLVPITSASGDVRVQATF